MNNNKSSFILKPIKRDKDYRGSILSIVDDNIQNVSIIECNEGVLRSNHYHKTDYHYMYVLEGEIDYFYTNLKKEKIQYIKVSKGQTVFTPKLEIHATFFPVKTKLIVSSLLPRDPLTYETDTVRVDFISKDNIDRIIKNI